MIYFRTLRNFFLILLTLFIIKIIVEVGLKQSITKINSLSLTAINFHEGNKIESMDLIDPNKKNIRIVFIESYDYLINKDHNFSITYRTTTQESFCLQELKQNDIIIFKSVNLCNLVILY